MIEHSNTAHLVYRVLFIFLKTLAGYLIPIGSGVFVFQLGDTSMKLFNNQEATCVLAGLRLLQDKINHEGMQSAKSMPHFDDIDPLESEELDMFCENINSGEKGCL